MPQKHIIFILFCLLFSTTTFGQKDLKAFQGFFEEQGQVFDDWLESEGFTALQLHSIKTTDTTVVVYLSLPFETTDSTLSAWLQTKKDFEKESHLLLEEALFYKAIQVMSVGQDVLNIQVYDKNGYTGGAICFFRGIYFDEGGVEVNSTRFGDCKADRYIELSSSDFSGMQNSSVIEFTKKWSKRRLFNAILDYAENHFGSTRPECSGRYPVLDTLENRRHLRFEIKDLCKEVLRDEENSIWCGMKSWLSDEDCNWRRREMLTFTFSYETEEDNIILHCKIDGKVGSGVFSYLEESGYHDMDADFKQLLEKYADRLVVDLLKYFKTMK